jgi:transcriptional regulator with XRE-family HTH domain
MPPKDLPVGQRVKALREAAGLSQQQLAVGADISLSMVFQMEQGKKQDPKLSTLVSLAGALGMKVGELAEELCRAGEAPAKVGKPGKKPKAAEPSGEKRKRGRPRKEA